MTHSPRKQAEPHRVQNHHPQAVLQRHVVVVGHAPRVAVHADVGALPLREGRSAVREGGGRVQARREDLRAAAIPKDAKTEGTGMKERCSITFSRENRTYVGWAFCCPWKA